MTKEQFADKLLSYIQSSLTNENINRDNKTSRFYLIKIKEYFEKFGDSYSPNAQDIELAENNKNKKGVNNDKYNK
jgi:hypothetical protein